MANATHNGHQTNGRVTIDDEPENPLHRLTPEQIEAIGREFDELHEEVKDSLGRSRRALHPLDHRAPAPARAARPRSS